MYAPLLSIVIPAYNEAQRIPLLLEALSVYTKDRPFVSEIILVNDGSTDETLSVMQNLQGLFAHVTVISHDTNLGKGAAVRTGMRAAHGHVRLFMDADLSTDIAHIDEFLERIVSEEVDIAIGSRAVSGAAISAKQPWYKQLFGKLGNWYIRMLILPGIYDTQCGFKAFSRRSAEHLFSELSFVSWSFDIELLLLAKKYSFSVREYPVEWSHTPASHVRLRDYLRVFLDVYRLKRRF